MFRFRFAPVFMLLLIAAIAGHPAAAPQQVQEPLPTPEAPEPADHQEEISSPPGEVTFVPPDEASIPDNEFGEMVRYGEDLFVNTDQLRGSYVGNGLKCVNCHLDRGRKANSAPLWGAWPMYPAFRKKTGKVDSMAERIQGCFLYSMNGKAPPEGSKELTALLTYHYWLAQGAPTGKELPGRGYPDVPKPKQEPDYQRGQVVYQKQCALCHGAAGEGLKIGEDYQFPPLWGLDSYNWGAGMHRVNTAASFIKYNMPLGKGKSLSDQEAWDVANFINSQERPGDPRFQGSVAETAKIYHDENCHYGEEINGKLLGAEK